MEVGEEIEDVRVGEAGAEDRRSGSGSGSGMDADDVHFKGDEEAGAVRERKVGAL